MSRDISENNRLVRLWRNSQWHGTHEAPAGARRPDASREQNATEHRTSSAPAAPWPIRSLGRPSPAWLFLASTQWRRPVEHLPRPAQKWRGGSPEKGAGRPRLHGWVETSRGHQPPAAGTRCAHTPARTPRPLPHASGAQCLRGDLVESSTAARGSHRPCGKQEQPPSRRQTAWRN